MKRAVSLAWIFLLVLISACATRPPTPAAAPAPAHNYARWDGEIGRYEQIDQTNAPPQGGLLFTGSSTIRLWKTLQSDFPDQPVINRGFGGCEIVDCTHFADRIIVPYRPRKIYLRCGGNDLWGGKSAEQVFADYKEFVAQVHARLPKTQIVFISLSPSIARWKQADKEKAVNAMAEKFTRGKSYLSYIETYDIVLGPDAQPRPELFVADKLHFNAAGYKLFAERLRPYVK